jgi:hypothetical protein
MCSIDININGYISEITSLLEPYGREYLCYARTSAIMLTLTKSLTRSENDNVFQIAFKINKKVRLLNQTSTIS